VPTDLQPYRTWTVAMRWSHLLFCHWPVPVAALRPHVPPMLRIDTFGGDAWLAVVPFTMPVVRPRLTPPLGFGPGAFHELNVRTYVTYRGEPGVWFFSLDASSPTGVAAGRASMRLAYLRARMSLTESGGTVRCSSERTDRRAPAAAFRATYAATGPARTTAPGTLEHFLTERYRLYTSDLAPRAPRHLWVGGVEHEPWRLSPAECEIETNSMTLPLGVDVSGRAPLLHAARALEVRGSLRRRVA